MVDEGMNAFARLKGITGKAELAEAIGREMATYSMFDVQSIGARLVREVGRLPSPYREKVRPYFVEQYFGRYSRVMGMYSSGDYRTLSGLIKDLKLFRDYCDMLTGAHTLWTTGAEIGHLSPREGLFYYLVSAVYMFALDEPGHPVGTPFPGGFTVQQRGAEFVCPIRDKEKDVTYSICNFCPAKQDEALL